MKAEINEQIAEARQQVERWKDLKASLPSAQERLGHENFRLKQIEAMLRELEAQAEALESFSLGALWAAVCGRKEYRLREAREQVEATDAERNQITEALLELDREVREIENQLNALGDPQRQLEELCERKQQEILASDCEAAQRLRGLLAELDVARSHRRALAKVTQVGRHLLERLQNLAGSLGRVRSKLVYASPLGVVGGTALNAMARHGAGAMTQRFREKLAEFLDCLQALDLSEGTDLDREIARLTDVMNGVQQDFAGHWEGKIACDRSALVPIMEQVQSLLSHLDVKFAQFDSEVVRLETERFELIEHV